MLADELNTMNPQENGRTAAAAAPLPARLVAQEYNVGRTLFAALPVGLYEKALPPCWSWDQRLAAAMPPREITLDRAGGNRFTAYNWENNFSNAGSDYQFQSDEFLSQSRTPGEAVRTRVAAARARGAAAIVTVPMIGYVAADGAARGRAVCATKNQTACRSGE